VNQARLYSKIPTLHTLQTYSTIQTGKAYRIHSAGVHSATDAKNRQRTCPLHATPTKKCTPPSTQIVIISVTEMRGFHMMRSDCNTLRYHGTAYKNQNFH